MTRPTLTKAQRRLVGAVAAGAMVIAAIGFAGSYAAVRRLAELKGFGEFARVFPIGVDAGIGVLLALDLLLTWLRIPFPIIRAAAWLLTVGTVAFNAAVAWPDPVGVGMHATMPVLFVAVVEAARHATGRVADITADAHMDSVRLIRWILAPASTFRLWRRMKLWELRSYDAVVQLERERIVYQTRLEMRHGRKWRRQASAEELMPLRLARYGESVTLAPAEEPDFDQVATEAVAVASDARKSAATFEPATRDDATHDSGTVRHATVCDVTPGDATVRDATAEPATPGDATHDSVTVRDATAETATRADATVRDATADDATRADGTRDDATAEPATRADATSQTRRLNTREVANLLRVKPGTVRKWVERRQLTPADHDHQGHALFDLADIEAHVTKRGTRTPSEEGQ